MLYKSNTSFIFDRLLIISVCKNCNKQHAINMSGEQSELMSYDFWDYKELDKSLIDEKILNNIEDVEWCYLI